MLVKLNVRVINIIATTYLWSNYLVSSLFPSFSRLKASNNRQSAFWTHQSTNYEESIASHKKISIFDTAACQTVIVGSGPAGLATAIMLARAGVKGIKLYDQLNEPVAANDSAYWSNYAADRSYLIGLNGKGQRSLQELDVMDRILKYSTILNGAITWNPDSPVDKPQERDFVEMRKTYRTVCIERERIAACLLEEIRERYNQSIAVHFDVNCTGISLSLPSSSASPSPFDSTSSWDLQLQSPTEGSFREQAVFLIGADGTNSVVRDAMLQLSASSAAFTGSRFRFFLRRFEDTNVRFYRTIPLYLPTNPQQGGFQWKQNVSYSARVRSDVNLEALPGPEGTFLGVVLYRPWDRRLSNETMRSAEDARGFFRTHFPAFEPCLRDEDLARFAKKKDSKFSRFLFVEPVLHFFRSVERQGRSTGAGVCLVGDSAHTVKPFFGLGVNSAFEDVSGLQKAIRESDGELERALVSYSAARAPEAKELVELSRGFDGGFLAFVLPIIVDSLFNRVWPAIFAPSAISLMQNDQFTYGQVRSRKRLDRIGQGVFLVLFAGMLTSLAKGFLWGFKTLLKSYLSFS